MGGTNINTINLPPSALLAISDNNTIQRSQSYAVWSAQTHGAAAEDWISDREKVAKKKARGYS